MSPYLLAKNYGIPSHTLNFSKKDKELFNNDSEFIRTKAIINGMMVKDHAAVIEFQVKKVNSIEYIIKWFTIQHNLVSKAITRWKENCNSPNNLFSIHPTNIKSIHLLSLVSSIYCHIRRAIKVSNIYDAHPENFSKPLLLPSEQIMTGFLIDIIHFIFTGTWKRYKKLFETTGMDQLLKKYNIITFPSQFFHFPSKFNFNEELAQFNDREWFDSQIEIPIPERRDLLLTFHVHHCMFFSFFYLIILFFFSSQKYNWY